MYFKIQGKDFSANMTDIKLKLVRTYKGEINRTQTGKIAAFPTSFITVGFDMSFIGPRDTINQLQQLLLSADLVEIITNYNGTSLKGKFSCTSNDMTEVRDRKEASLQLNISIVSDGSNITPETASFYTITRQGATSLAGFFGQVINVGNYKLGGASLPEGKLLCLGNAILTT